MFKRLRERIVEEVRHGPGPLRFPAGTTPNQNLIDLDDSGNSNASESPDKPVKFTIADEDDEEVGNQGHQTEPASKVENKEKNMQVNSSGSLNDPASPGLPGDFFLWYTQPQGPNYVPQSDIESEIDDPVATPNLDGVSKEEIFAGFQKLRARLTKYKSKYSEVVKAYKDVRSEKDKVMQILSENQDRALRRISELKEQCQLEQQAKAHLEDNLRVMLDEKEQLIHVLETKVRLLKEGNTVDVDSITAVSETSAPSAASSQQSIDREELDALDAQAQQDKVKRLEELLTRCKTALHGNRERNSALAQENASLSQQLEAKNNEIQAIQEKEAEVQAQLRNEMRELKEQLESLHRQQEESAMAMAETKRNMHEELENRERQLSAAKEEVKATHTQKEALDREVKMLEQKTTELEKKLEVMERAMEEEKQTLMQELSRGKAAAISLIREETEKKLQNAEEEMKMKMKAAAEEEEKLKQALAQKESEMAKLCGEMKALKEKSDQDVLELQKLQQNEEKHRKEMEAIRSEFEERIAGLEKEQEAKKQEYEDSLKKVQESSMKEIEMIKTSTAEQLELEKSQQLQALKDEMESLLQQLQDRQMKLGDKEKDIVDLSEKCQVLEKQLGELRQAQETIKSLTLERDTLTGRITDLEDRLREADSKMANLMDTLQKREHELSETQKISENLQQSREELTAKFEERFSKENEELKALKEAREKEVQALKNESETLSQQLQENQRKLTDKEQEVDDLCKKYKALEKQLQEALASHQDSTKSLTLERDTLVARIADLENMLQQADSKISAQLEVTKKTQEELDKTTEDIKHTREELESCKEAMQKENETLKIKLKEAEELSEKLRKEKEEHVRIEENLRESIILVQNERSELATQLEMLQQQIESKEASSEQWQTLLSGKEEQMTNLNNRMKDLEVEVCEMKQVRDKALEHVQQLENQVVILQEIKKELESKVEASERKLERQLEENLQEKESLAKKLKAAEEKIKELESNLEQQIHSEKEEVVVWKTSLDNYREQYEQAMKLLKEKEEESGKLKKDAEDLQAKLTSVEKTLQDAQSAFEEQLQKEKDQSKEYLEIVKQKLIAKIKMLQEEGKKKEAEHNSVLKSEKDERLRLQEVVHVLEGKLEALSKDNQELLAGMVMKEQRLRELDSEITSMRNGTSTAVAEYAANIETLKRTHATELQQMKESSDKMIQEARMDAEQKMVEIKQRLESEKEAVAVSLQSVISDLQASHEGLKRDNEIQAQQINEARATIAELKTQIEEQRKVELVDNATNTNISQSQVADVTTQDDLISEELQFKDAKQQEDLAALREEIDKLMSAHKKEVEQLNSELEVRTHQLDESLLVAEANQSNALQQLLQVRKEVEDIRGKLVEVEAERNRHWADLEKLRAEKEEAEVESQKQIHDLAKQVEHLQEKTTATAEPVEADAEGSIEGENLAETVQELQKQVALLKEENHDLVSKLQLAGLCSRDEEDSLTRRVQEEWEARLAAKEEETSDQLKQVVRSFSSQLESKEAEHERALEEVIEKSRKEEERLLWEHRKEIVSLEMELAEKNAALEDVHEYYQQQLQEKNEQLKMLSQQIKDLPKQNVVNNNPAEETWSPEQVEQPLSPVSMGRDGFQQINPGHRYAHRYSPDTVLPEPTEFEYLRNILFEYMMGKEPLTLAKVIAAVLRFSEDQTNQILQKEEARQFLQKPWLPSPRT